MWAESRIDVCNPVVECMQYFEGVPRRDDDRQRGELVAGDVCLFDLRTRGNGRFYKAASDIVVKKVTLVRAHSSSGSWSNMLLWK